MTNDRHDPDATPQFQDEFWGEQTEWTPSPPVANDRAGLGATVGRWWNGLAGGAKTAARSHGEPRVRSHHADEAATLEISELDDTAWDLEPEPQPVRQSGVDPLIARLGGLAVVLTLAAPLVLGITASGSDTDGAGPATIESAADVDFATDATSAVPESSLAAAVPATPSSTSPDVAVVPESDGAAEVAQVAEVAEDEADEPAAAESPQTAALEAAPEPAPSSSTAPTTTVAACGSDYELAAGDYWIRIADAAGVGLADLLRVNNASVDTVLVPGRSICLPAGASTPSPPPTTAAPAPSNSSSSSSTSSGNSTTQAPTTTAPAPTTTAAPARPSAVPESQATAIIREIWPDELEEKALQIAWRESNHRSNVNNFCCYGLFQIYFSVHRSWLATLGINSAQDLFDPRANTIAAYTLYQRAGGWGPWGG